MPRRRRAKKNRFSALLKILLFLLFIGCIFLFFFSVPLWNIDQIKVAGTRLLIPEDIINIADLPLGENIFLIRLAPSLKELKKLPQVENVKIKRQLPSTLLIEVKEREPFAVVLIAGNSFIIDREGVVLNFPSEKVEVVLPDISGLPVVSGLKKGVLGKDFCLDRRHADAIRETFENLFKILDSRRLRLEMAHVDDINLLVEDVLKVKLGRPENLEKKINNFKALLPLIKDDFNKIEYVDLRYVDNPAIKFRS